MGYLSFSDSSNIASTSSPISLIVWGFGGSTTFSSYGKCMLLPSPSSSGFTSCEGSSSEMGFLAGDMFLDEFLLT